MFQIQEHGIKKFYESSKTLTSILESVDTVVVIATPTTYETLDNIGVGLVVVPFSARVACVLPLAKKVLHKR